MLFNSVVVSKENHIIVSEHSIYLLSLSFDTNGLDAIHFRAEFILSNGSVVSYAPLYIGKSTSSHKIG